jgi:serine/threonine protein kinase
LRHVLEQPSELPAVTQLAPPQGGGPAEVGEHGLEAGGPKQTIGLSFAPTEQIGSRIGPYKILEQLGEGGCGIVYLAEQEKPVRRRVALKVIKPGMDSKQVLARFEAERQALALMDHPNIAKVLDAGATEHGRPYFVMEWVKGIRITDYCDRAKLSTRERLDLFVQVCQAIQHAHQKGIIHRDIKPSNVLVSLQDGVATPKVIDFGIAKATTGQPLTDKTIFTAFEQFIGTPAYMSPEQAELTGLDIDTRSDIYALGVLLYELLTGHTPFDAKELLAKGLDEIRRIIREDDPPRPSTRLIALNAGERTALAKQRQTEPPKLLGTIRGDLDWIVMKTLEKERSRRYETAGALALEIKRFVTNQPVTARPPSNVYRFQKLLRRNKSEFVTAGVIACLVLAILVLTRFAGQARRSEQIARQRFLALESKPLAPATAHQAPTIVVAKAESVGVFLHPALAKGLASMLVNDLSRLTNVKILESIALGDVQTANKGHWKSADFTLKCVVYRFGQKDQGYQTIIPGMPPPNSHPPHNTKEELEVRIDWRLIDNQSREVSASGRANAVEKGSYFDFNGYDASDVEGDRDFINSGLGKATMKAINEISSEISKLTLHPSRR